MTADTNCGQVLDAMKVHAEQLDLEARIAAKSGMRETGAALRNKAAGIRIAIEILKKGGAL